MFLKTRFIVKSIKHNYFQMDAKKGIVLLIKAQYTFK